MSRGPKSTWRSFASISFAVLASVISGGRRTSRRGYGTHLAVNKRTSANPTHRPIQASHCSPNIFTSTSKGSSVSSTFNMRPDSLRGFITHFVTVAFVMYIFEYFWSLYVSSVDEHQPHLSMTGDHRSGVVVKDGRLEGYFLEQHRSRDRNGCTGSNRDGGTAFNIQGRRMQASAEAADDGSAGRVSGYSMHTMDAEDMSKCLSDIRLMVSVVSFISVRLMTDWLSSSTSKAKSSNPRNRKEDTS